MNAKLTHTEFCSNLPLLHTFDNGKSWNTGGFNEGHLHQLHEFLIKNLPKNPSIIETGAGNSTISFLFLTPKKLITIAPANKLFERILQYANEIQIATDALQIYRDGSEWVLPKLAEACRGEKKIFDFCLMDGSHGWPMVFVDFCYLNHIVRDGGYIMLDDVQLHTVKELARFLIEQPGFKLTLDLGKSLVFQKISQESNINFEWNTMPYIVRKTEEYSKMINPYALD